ncbi:hypothetical protein HK105_208016 [Polyrhizophydium stewartii]|uniref:Uncharacterized protein n=1 Tax=Polyrhizophydium stewartii TaxID=2732419 RepID=A0ABR4MZ32_9FUNG
MSADCAVLAALPVATSLAGCCSQAPQVVCTNGRVSSLWVVPEASKVAMAAAWLMPPGVDPGRSIDVAATNLTAVIDAVAALPALSSLRVAVSGGLATIPDSIGRLTGLSFLTITNSGLVGSIPSSLASLPSLQALDLSRNNLTSAPSLAPLSALIALNLSRNQFAQNIASLGLASAASLLTLDLSYNNFNQDIEAQLPSRTFTSL